MLYLFTFKFHKFEKPPKSFECEVIFAVCERNDWYHSENYFRVIAFFYVTSLGLNQLKLLTIDVMYLPLGNKQKSIFSKEPINYIQLENYDLHTDHIENPQY